MCKGKLRAYVPKQCFNKLLLNYSKANVGPPSRIFKEELALFCIAQLAENYYISEGSIGVA